MRMSDADKALRDYLTARLIEASDSGELERALHAERLKSQVEVEVGLDDAGGGL